MTTALANAFSKFTAKSFFSITAVSMVLFLMLNIKIQTVLEEENGKSLGKIQFVFEFPSPFMDDSPIHDDDTNDNNKNQYNERTNFETDDKPLYDSMNGSLAKPIASPNIEDALLSASHGRDDRVNDDERSSVISAFNTTKDNNNYNNYNHNTTKRPRKESFFNQGSATVFSSIMNLCNTVIGAGILALPETMTHTGWILGFVLLIIFAILAQTSLHLAMMSGLILKLNNGGDIELSYLVMCQATIPKLKALVDLAVGITCFGVCCAYLVVIGDLMPDVISQIIDRTPGNESSTTEDILESRQLWIVIFLICFIIPVTRLKNMDALRFTSTAAIICFTYVTIIVVLYAYIDDLHLCDEDDPDRYQEFCIDVAIDEWPIDSTKDLLLLFKAAPTIIFAFTCHQNSFSVTNELRNPTPSSLNKIVFGSITICCVIYMIVAFSGYYSFGDNAPSNLLQAYPRDIPILIVRICLSFAIAFSYPVLAHPARNSFSSLLFKTSDSKELDWIKYNILTCAILLISFGISMITDDLGIVLALVGSTGTTTIAFILPGLFYYNLPNYMFEKYDTKMNVKIKKYLALSIAILGIILVPFSITMLFVEP